MTKRVSHSTPPSVILFLPASNYLYNPLIHFFLVMHIPVFPFPLSPTVFLSLSLSLSLPLSLSLSVSLYLSLYLIMDEFHNLSSNDIVDEENDFYPSAYLSQSGSLPLSLILCLSLPLSLPHCLSLYLSISLSLYLTINLTYLIFIH